MIRRFNNKPIDQSKKKYVVKITAMLLSATMIPSFLLPVQAEDYSNEEEWYEKCTKVLTSQEDVKACEGFQQYQNDKKASLQQSIQSFQGSIDELTDDVEQMSALAQEQKQIKEKLEAEIKVQEEAIAAIEASIEQLNIEIAQKQEEIDAWDAQIKSRMKAEQAASGTNSLADLIMGSSSLADMLRRISGLERITESDQDQIRELNKLKEQLQFQIEESRRLQEQHQNQINLLDEDRQAAAELEESYNQLVAEYEMKAAELEAAMRSAQIDMESIKDFVISADLSSNIDYGSLVSVDGFVNPVPGGRTSAGTWAYNGGGLHLGLDRAAPIGTPVIAPASGVIVAANNSSPTNGGFLGNWSGFPMGSGNFIAMVCNVNGTTYAISFSHLSQDFYVKPGNVVSQGQTLALSGNAGNSSGPHTHIEVYNLGSQSVQDAVAQFQQSADASFGTGWGTTSTACDYKGSAPCRERPEKFF
ncbi:murein hydrolase activator EnvC family protein [Ileibacterium valens]|uniref:murein hydrolase activator EnvC family protein n=1 Tax=Ileibacterium valens TaxID=1862668 RepID=UPI002572B18E|nr:M23 family metallopeptidase [Ileibacterium valens]